MSTSEEAITELAHAMEETRKELARLESHGNSNGHKARSIIRDVLIGVLVLVVVGTGTTIIGLRERVTSIEASRFTNTDGQMLEARLRAAIVAHGQEVREYTDVLRVDLTRLQEQTTNITARVERLERNETEDGDNGQEDH